MDHPSRDQKMAGHVVAEERGTRVVGHPALTCLLDRRMAGTGRV
jgi:hypothetical protein